MALDYSVRNTMIQTLSPTCSAYRTISFAPVQVLYSSPKSDHKIIKERKRPAARIGGINEHYLFNGAIELEMRSIKQIH